MSHRFTCTGCVSLTSGTCRLGSWLLVLFVLLGVFVLCWFLVAWFFPCFAVPEGFILFLMLQLSMTDNAFVLDRLCDKKKPLWLVPPYSSPIVVCFYMSLWQVPPAISRFLTSLHSFTLRPGLPLWLVPPSSSFTSLSISPFLHTPSHHIHNAWLVLVMVKLTAGDQAVFCYFCGNSLL